MMFSIVIQQADFIEQTPLFLLAFQMSSFSLVGKQIFIPQMASTSISFKRSFIVSCFQRWKWTRLGQIPHKPGQTYFIFLQPKFGSITHQESIFYVQAQTLYKLVWLVNLFKSLFHMKQCKLFFSLTKLKIFIKNI